MSRGRSSPAPFDSPLLRLPQELQIEVLSRCPDSQTLGAALTTCKAFSALAIPALRNFCFNAWPTHAAAAAFVMPSDTSASACVEFWGRAFLSAVTNAIASRQYTPDPALGLKHGQAAQLNARNRGILMEWITEVSIAWNLEGSLPFLAARFVDAYNAAVPLSSLKLLQLVGISALRVAMSHASPRSLRSATPWPESNPQPPPLPPSATDEQAAAQQASMLELHHFTDMCADAYTGQDVEAMCAAMEAVLAPQHRTARTCKHYLRSCLHAAAREQELLPASLMAPVRYLSGFLLHLSLLSVECCAACPAQLAAAALSVALETLGLPPWHPVLQRRVFATLSELEPLRARLRALQESAEVPNLRCQWRQLLKHVVHRYAQRAAVEAAEVADVEADAGAVEAAEVAAEAAAAEGAGGGGVGREAGAAGGQVFAGVAELGHVRRLVKAAGPMVRLGEVAVE